MRRVLALACVSAWIVACVHDPPKLSEREAAYRDCMARCDGPPGIIYSEIRVNHDKLCDEQCIRQLQ